MYKSSWNPNSNTLEPEWLQHDHPTSCIITEQYSSAMFCLIAHILKILLKFFYFFKIA